MATKAPVPRGPADLLDERSRRVLAAIVRDHTREGDPVGSQSIARDLDVSSATVRAVMADLEALGLLEKPHTSAGRIPTALGYRYYVDTLLKVRPPLDEERAEIERNAQGAASQLGGLMTAASKVLHSLTRHAGVVASPRPQTERLRRIELLQLREGRVLAVLVASSGRIQNRLLTVNGVSPSQLEQMSNFLNGLVHDLTLPEASGRLRRELAQDQLAFDELRARALALGAEAVRTGEGEVHIEGQASLLEDRGLVQDLAAMRALFRALEEKQRVLSILDRTLEARELCIFIGRESGIVEADLAVVAAPYRIRGELVGALGVIGPTRMDYSRVVPLVELTARTISATLESD